MEIWSVEISLLLSVSLHYFLSLLEKECARHESELTALVLISFNEINPEVSFLILICKKETEKQEISPKCLFFCNLFLQLLYNKVLWKLSHIFSDYESFKGVGFFHSWILSLFSVRVHKKCLGHIFMVNICEHKWSHLKGCGLLTRAYFPCPVCCTADKVKSVRREKIRFHRDWWAPLRGEGLQGAMGITVDTQILSGDFWSPSFKDTAGKGEICLQASLFLFFLIPLSFQFSKILVSIPVLIRSQFCAVKAL